MDMLIEVITVPVSNVDKAIEFYEKKVGFHLEGDWKIDDRRFVQLTPPGSACSIAIGEGITKAKTGSIDSIMLVVKDIQKMHEMLTDHGVEVTKPVLEGLGAQHAYFSDPDGNKWQLQQKPER